MPTRRRRCPLYREALRLRRGRFDGDEPMTWLDGRDSVLAFRRGELECWVNTGTEEVVLPEGDVLLGSDPSVAGGILPLGHVCLVAARLVFAVGGLVTSPATHTSVPAAAPPSTATCNVETITRVDQEDDDGHREGLELEQRPHRSGHVDASGPGGTALAAELLDGRHEFRVIPTPKFGPPNFQM